MDREARVKSLIISKGYNLKSFAKKIGIPYTTLLSMLKNGLGGAAVDNVIRVCKGLDITIEDLLCDDDSYQKNAEPDITDSEKELNDRVQILTDAFVKSGFIKPGDDITSKDLQFITLVAALINDRFDN